MRLSEIIDKPLSEILEQMELQNCNIDSHNGTVNYISLVYKPKEPVAGDNRSELFRKQKKRGY